MSSESLAALRKSNRHDLQKLAEEHFKHEYSSSLPIEGILLNVSSLQDFDRDQLRSAAGTISTWTVIGSCAGIALGALLATRICRNRQAMYNAFRTSEKPTALRFADGREMPIPDLAPIIRPTTLADVAAYTLFSAGGLFLIGELGLMGGTWSAKRTIMADEESRKRIERAFKNFRIDMLRQQIRQLENGEMREPIWE